MYYADEPALNGVSDGWALEPVLDNVAPPAIDIQAMTQQLCSSVPLPKESDGGSSPSAAAVSPLSRVAASLAEYRSPSALAPAAPPSTPQLPDNWQVAKQRSGTRLYVTDADTHNDSGYVAGSGLLNSLPAPLSPTPSATALLTDLIQSQLLPARPQPSHFSNSAIATTTESEAIRDMAEQLLKSHNRASMRLHPKYVACCLPLPVGTVAEKISPLVAASAARLQDLVAQVVATLRSAAGHAARELQLDWSLQRSLEPAMAAVATPRLPVNAVKLAKATPRPAAEYIQYCSVQAAADPPEQPLAGPATAPLPQQQPTAAAKPAAAVAPARAAPARSTLDEFLALRQAKMAPTASTSASRPTSQQQQQHRAQPWKAAPAPVQLTPTPAPAVSRPAPQAAVSAATVAGQEDAVAALPEPTTMYCTSRVTADRELLALLER